MYQTLRFRAQRIAREANTGARPALTIARTGEVRYISVSENIRLYTYSGSSDSAEFAPVDASLLVGRAEIASFADRVEISIGGTLALLADGEGVQVHSALDGQTYSDDVPRLEFWMDGARRGTLTQSGRIVALGFRDSADAPQDVTALRFEDDAGRWLFSIGQYVTARSMGDALP